MRLLWKAAPVFGPSGVLIPVILLLHHPSEVLSTQVLTPSWLILIPLQSANRKHSLHNHSTEKFVERNIHSSSYKYIQQKLPFFLWIWYQSSIDCSSESKATANYINPAVITLSSTVTLLVDTWKEYVTYDEVLLGYQLGFLTAQPFDLADSPRELHHTQLPGKQQI